MEFFISSASAQAAGAPAGAAGGGFGSIIMMVVMFGFIYFLMLRPQMKRAKEQRAMLSALAKGDEVATAAGLLGKVEEISESYVSIEIAPNVTVKLQKHAITAVLPKGTLKSA
ncbi:preprotein translocase subunit YajC [Tahibacter amnicola]|uniref:Sec translocon accessory complex subunit YajC n=2 Tax=Tahibacter amnicola TaxID=2976241 RepID=A0ABY6BQP2_9GAMM|nr:preprotein translocase subunit YajC [Tahibacter amnicola]UXI70735.1 preprotein translocase subunit YajC [Tahibacter amnicola]